MKLRNYVRAIAIFLSLLIISLPIIFAEELSRTYDANGNLISDGKYYREYNGLNQLVRVRLGNTSTSPVLEEYRHHPIEERIVTKRVFYNGVYNYTVHYPNENIVIIVNSSGTFYEKYVYQEGILVAQVNTDGQKQAIHSDYEGSNTLITDANGNLIENTFYSPYGEILEGGKSSRFDYEAKEFDSQVEDYDFHFRKYKPEIPIFNQPDTLIQDVYDPQSLNRYSFERNNPLKYTDPTGHDFGLAALFLTVLAIRSAVIWVSAEALPYLPGLSVVAQNWIFRKAGKEYINTVTSETPEFKLEQGTYVPDDAKRQQRELCKLSNTDCSIKKNELDLNYNQESSQSQTSSADSNLNNNINSQANLANERTNQQTNAINNAISSGGGFVSGVGYVTSGGKVYPTKNKDFVPGTGNKPSSPGRETGCNLNCVKVTKPRQK